MSGVSFDEEPSYLPARSGPAAVSQQGSIMNLMFKLGLARTQKDATVILSGIIVVCIILSATMIVVVQPHPSNNPQLQRDVARFEAAQRAAPPARSPQ